MNSTYLRKHLRLSFGLLSRPSSYAFVRSETTDSPPSRHSWSVFCATLFGCCLLGESSLDLWFSLQIIAKQIENSFYSILIELILESNVKSYECYFVFQNQKYMKCWRNINTVRPHFVKNNNFKQHNLQVYIKRILFNENCRQIFWWIFWCFRSYGISIFTENNYKKKTFLYFDKIRERIKVFKYFSN